MENKTDNELIDLITGKSWREATEEMRKELALAKSVLGEERLNNPMNKIAAELLSERDKAINEIEELRKENEVLTSDIETYKREMFTIRSASKLKDDEIERLTQSNIDLKNSEQSYKNEYNLAMDAFEKVSHSNKELIDALKRCRSLIKHFRNPKADHHPQDGDVTLSFLETIIQKSEGVK